MTPLIPLPNKAVAPSEKVNAQRRPKPPGSRAPSTREKRLQKRRSTAPAGLRSARVQTLLQPGRVVAELESIRDRLAKIDRKHRDSVFDEIAKLRELHIVLTASRDAWAEFCRRPEWEDNNPRMRPKLDEVERSAVFVADLVSGGHRKKRTRLANALKELEAQDVRPPAVVRKLRKHRGIRGLAEAWTSRMKNKRRDAGFIPSADEGVSETGSSRSELIVKSTRSKGAQVSVKPVASEQFESALVRMNAAGREILTQPKGFRGIFAVEILDRQDGMTHIKFKRKE